MNKKQIVASLNKIANELDNSGLYAEASTVTKVMSRLAADDDYSKAYFEKNPDAPRNYAEAYFEKYPNAPRGSYRNNPDFTSFTEDPDGFMTDRFNPKTSDNLFEKYRDNNQNDVISALDEAIKDMKDLEGVSISKEEIDRVEEIRNELERLLS